MFAAISLRSRRSKPLERQDSVPQEEIQDSLNEAFHSASTYDAEWNARYYNYANSAYLLLRIVATTNVQILAGHFHDVGQLA